MLDPLGECSTDPATPERGTGMGDTAMTMALLAVLAACGMALVWGVKAVKKPVYTLGE
jgi:hypothetical protein